MSDRERWIVYPLLFLALGSTLWSKMTHNVPSPSVRCQELVVVDRNDRPRVVIRGNASISDALKSSVQIPGEVVIVGDDNRPRVVIGSRSGAVVETRSPDGQLRATAPDDSGHVLVFGDRNQMAVGLGHDGNCAGLLFVDPKTLRSAVMPGLPIDTLLQRAWNALPRGTRNSSGTSPKTDAPKQPRTKRPPPSASADKANPPATKPESSTPDEADAE